MKKDQKPFFARFLENEPAKIKSGVKAGKGEQTQKAPSDNDEW